LQAHPAVATNTAQGLHAEEIDSLRHGHADSSEVIMMTDCPPTPQQHIQYSIFDSIAIGTANCRIIDLFLHLNRDWSPRFSTLRDKTAGNGSKRPEI
jgi:hypothetical protein